VFGAFPFGFGTFGGGGAPRHAAAVVSARWASTSRLRVVFDRAIDTSAAARSGSALNPEAWTFGVVGSGAVPQVARAEAVDATTVDVHLVSPVAAGVVVSVDALALEAP